jgi:Trk-type K+ transport system membrane component
MGSSMRTIINTFWGTLAAWTTICGYGFALYGISLFDYAHPVVALFVTVVGLGLGIYGYRWEQRVRQAAVNQRAYSQRDRV